MKKRIILISFITFTFFLASLSPAWAALRAEPVSRSPFNQRDRYETDLFTGGAAYSYPISVPKGTNDLTPEVSLSYNSHGARDFSNRVGSGWQLNQDYIERDVNYSPTNTGDDKFKLYFKGGVYDLIYLAGENRYHTKTESYLNIQKLTGGQNEKSEYWQVITQDGTKYRFGYQNQSELMCNGRDYINSWNLDQVEDAHGNKIFYTYAENGGLSYVTRIEYNNDKTRLIDIIYETNPYQRGAYIQGCNVTELSRLLNIQVKITTGTILVRQYYLTYIQAGNNQNLLQSITEKAGNGSALPATTFMYKAENRNWSTQPVKWLDHAEVDSHLRMAAVGLVDANGDGLMDIVRTLQVTGGSTWKILLNQGNNWSSQFQTWNNSPIGDDPRLDRTDTRIMDVTGDNLPDIIMANGADQWRVWRNSGTGFNTQYEVWANLSSIHSEIHLNNNRVRLVDVTGDGLPDIVRTWWNGQQQWEVIKNSGSSWNGSPIVWSYATIPQGLDDPQVAVIDVNGDGLNDVVKTTNSGTNVTWIVYKNSGSGFISGENWINNANVDAYISKGDVTMADADGDGLVDIIKSDDGGGSDRWKILRNMGNSWSTTWETWIDPSSNQDIDVHNDDVRLADVTGDGLIDIVRGREDCSCNFDTWTVWKNNGQASSLLASVKTSQGGTISFDYVASTKKDNTGADDKPDLPFNLWLVEKKTENNGMTGAHLTNDITTYNYQDGYYKWQDKEFRGFGTIDENLPDTSKKKYVFNQDDALKGLLAEVQTRDNGNNPYAETENIWSSSQANGVYTVKLDSEKNYTYDGTAANPKITQTDYIYDGYGNVTKKSELGDAGVNGDERYTYYEYVVNSALWIVNTVIHTYQNKSNDVDKASQSWFYYDGHTVINDTPVKGDITKEVKWLEGGSNPQTLYEYDSFGNKTRVTDANNHATSYAYDTTGAYQTSTTNAKNQTTSTSYDLGTGNLLSKTDPNGFTTSYNYDVFGRITKEIKLYDDTNFPTTAYQYFNDGNAPEGTLISKREASGAGDILDIYTWFDGFGKKVQTRAEAEDANKQIVANTFYDQTGEVEKETIPHLDTTSATYANPVAGTRVTEMTYDPLQRVTIVKNPKGDVKTTAYDHWKETNIDENGKIKRNYLNAFGKITKVEEVNGVNTYTTNYEYNSRDELTKITDALGNIDTITYDSLGRRKSQVDPDMGTWQYEYDGVGNLTRKTDNRNVATTITYDELDRKTRVDLPTETDVVYTYDGNSKIGTLTSITDAAGTLSYAYDNRLRKTQEQRIVDGITFTTQFAYDALDRVTSRTNPDGQAVAYTHNAQGETESVTGILSNIDYNAQGKITKKDFGNGLATNYSYSTSIPGQPTFLNDPNLVSYWKLDGNSNDSKGSNNGTDVNITYNDGKFSQTSSFNGSSSKINVGDTGLDATRLTISAWVYLAGNQISREFISKYSQAGGAHGFGFGISDSSTNKLKWWINGINLETSSALNNGTWYHVAATYDGAHMKIYINGVEVAVNNSTTDPTYGSTDGYIGALSIDGAFAQFLNGYIDDLAFFNRALSPTEISQIYNSTADLGSIGSGNDVFDYRLSRIQTGTVFDSGYTYDNVGNVLTITDNLLTKTQTFGYDDLHRLISASETGGYTHAYEYNAIGNLTKFTDAGTPIDYTYGQSAGPHALTSSTEIISTPTPSPTPIATPTPTPGGSVPVVRSSNSGSVSSGGLTLNKPTGTVDGDLLILTASADLSASEDVAYTIPSGWTQLLANTRSDTSSAGNNLQVWYKIASSESASYTITPDHDNLIGGSIIRVDGHSASPIHADGVTASDTGEASAPSVTTTVNNTLILRLVTWDQSKTLNAIPSGHTQAYHVDVSGHDNWGGYKDQAIAGSTGVAQFDLSAGSGHVGYTVAIK